MKKIVKFLITIVLALCLFTSFSCGSEDPANGDYDGSSELKNPYGSNQVYNANYVVHNADIQKSSTALTNYIVELGGYILNFNERYDKLGNTNYALINFAVPSDEIFDAISYIDNNLEVSRKNIFARNVNYSSSSIGESGVRYSHLQIIYQPPTNYGTYLVGFGKFIVNTVLYTWPIALIAACIVLPIVIPANIRRKKRKLAAAQNENQELAEELNQEKPNE